MDRSYGLEMSDWRAGPLRARYKFCGSDFAQGPKCSGPFPLIFDKPKRIGVAGPNGIVMDRRTGQDSLELFFAKQFLEYRLEYPINMPHGTRILKHGRIRQRLH